MQAPQNARDDAGARCYALVPCAGSGSRAGAAGPKQYAPLAGQPLVAHALAALARVAGVDGILVVLAPGDERFASVAHPDGAPITHAHCGGESRAASVRAGLDALAAQGARRHDWVLVHDAARCLIEPEWVVRLIAACRQNSVGGLLAVPLADTLKSAQGDRALSTLPREDKWLAQTPQMFRLGELAAALDAGPMDGITDEASAMERAGQQPLLVMGHADNFKVTYPEDFERAERVLAWRSARSTP